jgi:hypothetical protein
MSKGKEKINEGTDILLDKVDNVHDRAEQRYGEAG